MLRSARGGSRGRDAEQMDSAATMEGLAIPQPMEFCRSKDGFLLTVTFHWQFQYQFPREKLQSVRFDSKFRSATFSWRLSALCGDKTGSDNYKKEEFVFKKASLTLEKAYIPEVLVNNISCNVYYDGNFDAPKVSLTSKNKTLYPYIGSTIDFNFFQQCSSKNILVVFKAAVDGGKIFPEYPPSASPLCLEEVRLVSSTGEGVDVPKRILIDRSPVFARMFEHNMKESTSNVVDVVDVDKPTLDALRSYLCEDELPTSSVVLEELLKTAEKYDVPDLKTAASLALGEHLRGHRVPELLDLSRRYRATELRGVLAVFLNKMWAERNDEEWRQFVVAIRND